MLVPRSGLTPVSYNDKNHQNRKKILNCKKPRKIKKNLKQKFGCQMDIRETNSDYQMEKG